MALTEQEELELLELEREQSLAQTAADTPDDIGGLVDGKIKRGRLTDDQLLQILNAQLADPARDPASTPELQRQIQFVSKRMGRPPVNFAAPRASQADVRRAEPAGVAPQVYPEGYKPMQKQELEEHRFDAARQQWMRATGGRLKPGQTVSQAVTEWSGIKNPRETRAGAEVQHMAETGEYVDDDSVAYEGAKMLAGIGGFALAGPAGATASELAVRAASLKRRLAEAKKAGLSEDEADSIFAREMAVGITTDAAFNFGIPVLGTWISKLVGSNAGKKFAAILESTFGKDLKKVDKRADPRSLVEKALRQENPVSPERQEAVRELSARMPGGKVPTPGQVAGEASTWEAQARKSSPSQFAKQEQAMYDAAEQMRHEAFYPGGQPKRAVLGERIVQIADDTVKAMKDRLRPVFNEADDLGVKVDLSSAAARARAALEADAARPTSKFVPKEIAELQDIMRRIEGEPRPTVPGALTVERGQFSAEDALDMLSTLKQKLRATTADWKPSEFFETVMNGLARDVDAAYETAARKAGKGDVLERLLSARNQYRTVMETVFDDAMKAALRKEAGGSPEDISAFLWQSGKVSRLEQLNDLLKLAQGEGKLSASRAAKLQRDVTRGFLQEAIPNVEALANFSASLAAQPRRKETWDVLTSTPGGKELVRTVKVLEEAAKMAMTDTTRLTGAPLLLNPSAAEAFARRGLTGAQRPHWFIGALSYTGLMRAAATAYTHGNTGVLNTIAQIVNLRNAKAGAAAKTAQKATESLQSWASENDVDLESE